MMVSYSNIVNWDFIFWDCLFALIAFISLANITIRKLKYLHVFNNQTGQNHFISYDKIFINEKSNNIDEHLFKDDNSKLTELKINIDQIIASSYKFNVNDNDKLEACLNLLQEYSVYIDNNSFLIQVNREHIRSSILIFLSISLALKKLLELEQKTINTIFHFYKTTTKNLLQDYFLITSNKGFNTNLHIHDLQINDYLYIYHLFSKHSGDDHEKLIPI